MKKKLPLLLLLIVINLSVAQFTVVFADGDLPNGNKACPQGQQTCLVEPPVQPPAEESKDEEEKESTVLILLKEIQFIIFGIR